MRETIKFTCACGRAHSIELFAHAKVEPYKEEDMPDLEFIREVYSTSTPLGTVKYLVDAYGWGIKRAVDYLRENGMRVGSG